jgi:hypothetical protein
MHYKPVNARAVTARIFTREEQGQNDCQVRNSGISLYVNLKWIVEKS